MKVNRRWVWVGLVFLLVILIFAVLTWFFWDFMRDTVALPIYFILWITDLFLKSVPQQIYLGIVVVICIFILLNTLITIGVRPVAETVEDKHYQPATRYAFWRKHCAALHTSQFSRERFAFEARELILSVLAYDEGISVGEVEALCQDGALPLPEVIHNLIDKKGIRGPQPIPRTLKAVLERMRQVVRSTDSPPDPQTENQLAEIISYIESRLEITNAENQFEP